MTEHSIISLNRLSAGYSHICADTSVEPHTTAHPDYSQLHCWGSNSKNESTPDPTWHSLGTPWYISAGLEYTCAILRQSNLAYPAHNEKTITKTAVCWGANEHGQVDIPRE